MFLLNSQIIGLPNSFLAYCIYLKEELRDLDMRTCENKLISYSIIIYDNLVCYRVSGVIIFFLGFRKRHYYVWREL